MQVVEQEEGTLCDTQVHVVLKVKGMTAAPACGGAASPTRHTRTSWRGSVQVIEQVGDSFCDTRVHVVRRVKGIRMFMCGAVLACGQLARVPDKAGTKAGWHLYS